MTQQEKPLKWHNRSAIGTVWFSVVLREDTSAFRAHVSLTQMLTFYELDLGLNHVVRKYSEPLEDTANMLISGV